MRQYVTIEVKGRILSGLVKPEKVTKEINKLASKGWTVVAVTWCPRVIRSSVLVTLCS